ncbi:uncharacterized protein LOC112568350 isoform X2 [Pomacea canaliculata]|uniref:uncharacterized protein LOC112568350 isoform X2 n=1 Tax=Pomacea canaliculata TaxID=400727 RepID=UPI000D732FF6|nr:uncharacterized protein LOC112568350 isoform X2 [Pomacea canaliculata]
MVCFDSSLPVIVAVLLMSMTMTIQATADIKCPEMKFLNDKNDVIHTKVETNITFSVRFDNCSTDDILIVKISEKMTEKCKIVYNRSVCLVSELSSSCSCTPVTGLTTFVARRNETGNITYTWSWRLHGSEEYFRNITVVFSDYDTTDHSSSDYVFIIIIVGSTGGSLTVIIVVTIILVICRKRVKETFTLPIPFPDWSDDCRAHDQDRKEQLERRYQEIINDAPGHPSFEKEGRDPESTHSMSQDRPDLVRQSSGSLYGQVYDVFLGETATDGAAY